MSAFKEYDSYQQAGLIVLGKTNTPEFGLVAYTAPELFGPCRNPWNPGHTPGSSGGGSAPLHWSDEGLPCSVQFIAPSGEEALLFRLAAQLERAEPGSINALRNCDPAGKGDLI